MGGDTGARCKRQRIRALTTTKAAYGGIQRPQQEAGENEAAALMSREVVDTSQKDERLRLLNPAPQSK